jgi:sugar/nucleoside kinase (ribokinase family)
MPAFDAREFLDLLKFCRSRKITTVVDVVLPQDWDAREEVKLLLPHIDYFLPNSDEARVITGEADTLGQARALTGMGAGTVIITRGRLGSLAAQAGRYWKCGIFPATVVDPSGSGDAFSSGILTGLRRGWDLARTLRYASALGASATRAVGTTDGVFTAREAAAFIRRHPLPVATGKL